MVATIAPVASSQAASPSLCGAPSPAASAPAKAKQPSNKTNKATKPDRDHKEEERVRKLIDIMSRQAIPAGIPGRNPEFLLKQTIPGIPYRNRNLDAPVDHQ